METPKIRTVALIPCENRRVEREDEGERRGGALLGFPSICVKCIMNNQMYNRAKPYIYSAVYGHHTVSIPLQNT